MIDAILPAGSTEFLGDGSSLGDCPPACEGSLSEGSAEEGSFADGSLVEGSFATDTLDKIDSGGPGVVEGLGVGACGPTAGDAGVGEGHGSEETGVAAACTPCRAYGGS
jgi:hypothetical protein